MANSSPASSPPDKQKADRLKAGNFRDGANYFAALLSEAMAQPLRLIASFITGQPPTPPKTWKRGIILGASHIGDVLYRTGSLAHLQESLPECSWHYLLEENSACLLRGHIPEDRLVTFSPKEGSPWQNKALLNHCKSLKFDAALCTGGIGYWHELVFAIKARIPNRCAFTHKGFSGLVTYPMSAFGLPCPVPTHFSRQVAQLTNQLPDWSVRPKVVSTPDEIDAARIIATENKITPVNSFVMAMTTRQDAVIWDPLNFATLAHMLNEKLGLKVVLLGSSTDKTFLEDFSRTHNLNALILAGTLPLNAIVPFLRHVGFAVCTDSGVRHLANAAGIPVFYFRNLSCQDVETGAYLDTETDLTPPASFLKKHEQAVLLSSIKPHSVFSTISERCDLHPLQVNPAVNA